LGTWHSLRLAKVTQNVPASGGLGPGTVACPCPHPLIPNIRERTGASSISIHLFETIGVLQNFRVQSVDFGAVEFGDAGRMGGIGISDGFDLQNNRNLAERELLKLVGLRILPFSGGKGTLI